MNVHRMPSKKIAIIAVFTALTIAVAKLLPNIPVVGLPQGQGSISPTVILYPIIGLVLGPILGFLTAIIANTIVWIIPPQTIFGLLTIPAGGFAACISGYIARKPDLGWMKATFISAILVGCWYLTPIGFEAPLYPIPLHITAIALTLIFNKKLYSWLEESSNKRFRSIVALLITFFAAIMADHMWGNLMFILGVGLYIPMKTIRDTLNALGVLAVKMGLPNIPLRGLGDLFMFMLPVSAVERITMTVIATLVGLAVFRALKKYLSQI
jgi:uncharacterized membrane protein